MPTAVDVHQKLPFLWPGQEKGRQREERGRPSPSPAQAPAQRSRHGIDCRARRRLQGPGGFCCCNSLRKKQSGQSVEYKEQLSPSQLGGERKVCREFPPLPKVINIDSSSFQHNPSRERGPSGSAGPFTGGISRLVQAAAPPGFPDTFPLMNNLQDDYRGKPHEPSPCALPGAQGRPGQSISYRHGLELIALELLAVGNPRAGRLSGIQERGGCTAWEGRDQRPGCAARRTKLVGTGGSSQTATSRKSSVPPLPDLHHLLPPHRPRIFPSGHGDPHSSFHHSMGQELAQQPPCQSHTAHTTHRCPASLGQIQDGPTKGWTLLEPSNNSTPSRAVPRAPQQHRRGDRCPLLHLTKKQNTEAPELTGFTPRSSVPA